MALYLIGDIQGCHSALQQLLQRIDFSPSRDTLYVLGDMVNRGEDSLGVLQTLMRFGSSAQCVLGNHDLHLLAVAQGIRQPHPSDTLEGVLNSAHREAVLSWLRAQKLAIGITHQGKHWLMVHAGVLPQWSYEQTLRLAGEVEAKLQGAHDPAFLPSLFGHSPAQWHDDLQGSERARVIVNALTRLRFCDAHGVMQLQAKGGLNTAPAGYLPWFNVVGRKTERADVAIAFGHWSTLGFMARPSLQAPSLLALDTGYIWGGSLSCYCLSSAKLAVISAPTSTINQAT